MCKKYNAKNLVTHTQPLIRTHAKFHNNYRQRSPAGVVQTVAIVSVIRVVMVPARAPLQAGHAHLVRVMRVISRDKAAKQGSEKTRRKVRIRGPLR